VDKILHQPLGGNEMPRFGGIATMMRLPHLPTAAGLDAAFVGVPLDIGAFSTRMSGLVYMPLYREQHWLYCSSRHPLFTERRIPEQVITQQRMVGRGYWSQAELARHGSNTARRPWKVWKRS
jgi:DNA-binding transcriptional LysR family regulator